ncbi:thermolabile L-asparaginase [Xylaria acuta]|nr:thermolabile L-asparaginase [Xylaria acuta]
MGTSSSTIVMKSGTLLYTLGDPSRMTLIGSAAKPMRAIPMIESGAMERVGFDGADLALMCVKSRATESELQCGGHPAISPAVMQTWVKSGYLPSPACNTCSGNHIGVMAGAKATGACVAHYHTLSHPIQARIESVMEDLTGVGVGEIKWALDSCNIVAKRNGSESLRIQAMARIFNRMVRCPGGVGGDDRFCSVLIEAYEGALIGKGGGDGCHVIGIRESEDTRRLGAHWGIGVALKIEDGNYGVMDAASAELLGQLQIGTKEARQRLGYFHRSEIKNSVGLVIG